MGLKEIVESTDTKEGRAFDLTVQSLIVVSLLTFSVDTLPDLSDNWRRLLFMSEVIIVILFTLEYLMRLYVADRKLGFVFSFYGLIDLLAILPFYLAAGLDLRSVRVFRLLRLIRLFKLLRYSRAVGRFRIAFALAKEELLLFTAVTVILFYLAAVGIYYFENEAQPNAFASVFHSLWWAVATLTTVGYGDIYPVTLGGRVFTFVTLMIGLGIVAVPAGLMAASLAKARELQANEEEQETAEKAIDNEETQ